MDEKLLSEVVQRLTRIEVKLEEIVTVKKDVEALKCEVVELKAKDDAQQKEIAELKESNKWLTRTVIAGIFTVITGIVVTLLKGALGF